MTSVQEIPVSTIDGREATLADHAGKVLLVVNVASKCGLTPQYEALEALYEQRRGDGFEVLGFPANNFGAQEPGTNEEIAEFCALTYDVKFPLFAKVSVLGDDQHPLYRELIATLPEGVVALLGATLLFVLPTDRRRLEFTLPWSEAVKIDWWIVFLYGGGIALGTLAFKTGLAAALGEGLTGLLGIATSTLLATVLSETTSNTASANMVVPVAIALARSAGVDPVLPGVAATMGASLGFMLPVSTPCNAIVYGSGRIPLTAMMRYGLALDVAGIVAIVAVVALLGPVVLR